MSRSANRGVDKPRRGFMSTLLKLGAAMAGFSQARAGEIARTLLDKQPELVSVKDYGATGNGVTDDTAAIQAAFTASSKITFPDGSYLITARIAKASNYVNIDFGNAKIIAKLPTGGTVFSFGVTSNTAIYTGLTVKGGFFELSNAASAFNTVYIAIQGTKNFSVQGCNLKNVSNGGVYVQAGCEDGLIDNITVSGISGYSTCRGIWLNGATATDYASQLVDVSSITRNATAVPVHAVKNVKIINCTIVLESYGIYLINTRDCRVENNYIDKGSSGARCIAVNAYSPKAIIKGNTLVSAGTGTGILVTQYSRGVLIDGNVFKGTFGGGRDIYVAYLAEALITNNMFNTDSTQQILIDMGGSAIIRGNTFTRSAYMANTRAVKITTIDEAVAGTGTYGNTATTLPGSVFENNTVKIRVCPVYVNAPKSQSGNVPGLDTIVNRNNTFYNFETATAADEFGMRIYGSGTTYPVKYTYSNNVVYPKANPNRNRTSISGTSGREVAL